MQARDMHRLTEVLVWCLDQGDELQQTSVQAGVVVSRRPVRDGGRQTLVNAPLAFAASDWPPPRRVQEANGSIAAADWIWAASGRGEYSQMFFVGASTA
ncbi:hypothetical protein RRG08_044542 [Elysia crispata]|uniref:Uncharacterized protein n=1 Tax=Elysia crispata TaxID=231223 RepID=A0AAE0ZBI9_9GAST|nr:hypothetical protein RRG08_044542 [Elysia crispata]